MLELELRLRANGKQCLEAVPNAQILDHSFGMFSRTTWSTTLCTSSIKMHADYHQIYVSGETMGDVETGL